MTMDESQAHEGDMNPDQKMRHTKLLGRWDATLNKWRSAITRKSEREMAMRLNLWRAYLSDLEEGSASHFDYHREVRNRVQFTRLGTLALKNSATLKMENTVRSLDTLLLSLTISSEFIWNARLREIYPEGKFGFLYRRPRENNK